MTTVLRWLREQYGYGPWFALAAIRQITAARREALATLTDRRNDHA